MFLFFFFLNIQKTTFEQRDLRTYVSYNQFSNLQRPRDVKVGTTKRPLTFAARVAAYNSRTFRRKMVATSVGRFVNRAQLDVEPRFPFVGAKTIPKNVFLALRRTRMLNAPRTGLFRAKDLYAKRIFFLFFFLSSFFRFFFILSFFPFFPPFFVLFWKLMETGIDRCPIVVFPSRTTMSVPLSLSQVLCFNFSFYVFSMFFSLSCFFLNIYTYILY